MVRNIGHHWFGGERKCPAVAASASHGVARCGQVESGVWGGCEEAVREGGGAGPFEGSTSGKEGWD